MTESEEEDAPPEDLDTLVAALEYTAAGLPPDPPFTAEHISVIMGSLRAAGYRCAPAYLGAAKRRHVLLERLWTMHLDLLARDAVRAALFPLGIGTPLP